MPRRRKKRRISFNRTEKEGIAVDKLAKYTPARNKSRIRKPQGSSFSIKPIGSFIRPTKREVEADAARWVDDMIWEEQLK